MIADAQEAYEKREEELGDEVARELERRVVLSVIDRKWREHLYEMDYLQEGIGLRAMAQKDPLVEYQREGYDLFRVMMEAVKEESVGYLFNVEVEVAADGSATADTDADAIEASMNGELATEEAPPLLVAKGLDLGQSRAARREALQYTAPSIDGEAGIEQHGETAAPVIDAEFGAVSKNQLCPCGSGKKYKRCHGDPKVRDRA